MHVPLLSSVWSQGEHESLHLSGTEEVFPNVVKSPVAEADDPETEEVGVSSRLITAAKPVEARAVVSWDNRGSH